ncbi:MAG: phosphate ABC transporter permease PstA [Bacteroidales bacterium]|nr:phosphate ABC transporter permease PstA [Bacteroidales bacterium]HNW73615.1 phosphate ABC transporter permease PstA [Bacteroidales bacterium]HPS50186.1 phosphate ABC transporter permease PstA [Bacteroidales bacterium]
MTRGQKIEERFFKVLMFLSTFFILAILAIIIYSIFEKGIRSISWEMLTEIPSGGYYYGKGGGILNAILGSLALASGATVIAFFVGLPVALYINVFLIRHKKIVGMVRFLLDLVWGIPSIVYGAFGFTLMIFLGLQTSLLAGTITVALFILPIMIRSIDEIVRTAPIGLQEASYSLGSNKSETAFRILTRQSVSGIITAILLSFGRAIGDAASVLFTAGYTDHLPNGLLEPVATLPLSIFFQLASPVPEVQNRAYASALVLTLIILLVSLFSRGLGKRYHKTKINF